MEKQIGFFKFFVIQKFTKSTVFISLLLSFITAHADIAIIVNEQNKGVSLSRTAVSDIFLGRSLKLPNGNSVEPFDESDNGKLRSTFYRLIAGKNSAEMNIYWSRLNFVGKGSPPVVLPNDSAVISRVASDPKAIGYVNAEAAKGASNVAVALLIPTT